MYDACSERSDNRTGCTNSPDLRSVAFYSHTKSPEQAPIDLTKHLRGVVTLHLGARTSDPDLKGEVLRDANTVQY